MDKQREGTRYEIADALLTEEHKVYLYIGIGKDGKAELRYEGGALLAIGLAETCRMILQDQFIKSQG